MEKIPQSHNRQSKSRAAVERTVPFKKDDGEVLAFVDNRSETVVQQKVIDMMRNSPLAKQAAQLKDSVHNSPRYVAMRQSAKTMQNSAKNAVQQALDMEEAAMQMTETQVNDNDELAQKTNVTRPKAQSMSGVSLIQLAHEKTNNVEPVQRKWDSVKENLMQWDENLGGLSWFYNTDNGLMSFEITNDSPRYMTLLKAYEDKPRPYSEWVEIWRENSWPASMFNAIKPKVQAFGTDIPKKGNPLISEPKERSEEKKINILVQAMKAGYTLFDTAELYCSAHLIEKAAKQAGVDVNNLTIVYKAKPVNDEKNSGSLEENVLDFSKRIKSQMLTLPAKSQKVLMLHALPKNSEHISAYIDALYDIAISGDAGIVESLGVSNVEINQLKIICQYAAEKKIMRVKYVQNRFSPSEQDVAVRQYCAENDINYMGFGLFGGSSTGFCSEGYAMPIRHLQMLQDPRLIDLAKQLTLTPHQMLLAWAKAEGVTTIIYSGSHAKDNFKAQGINLTSKVVQQIDAYFIFNKKETDSKYKAIEDISGLYSAFKDTSAWYIFDTLLKDGNVMGLFKKFLKGLTTQFDKQANEKILNFSMRLMRLVTHLQIMWGMGALKDTWDVVLVESFKKIAIAGEKSVDGVMDKLYDWSQKGFMEIGGATHAEENLETIAKGNQKEDPKIGETLALTKLNSTLIDAEFFKNTFAEFDNDETGYCLYAPNGLTKKPKYKLTVKIVSHTDSSAKVVITKLDAPI